MPDGKNRELAIVATILVIAAFAVLDCFTPLLCQHYLRDGTRWLVALAIGGCIAELTLVAAWAVFAPGNLVARLPWALLFGLAMWYLLVFGERNTAIDWRRPNPNEEFMLGEILLAGVIVLQVPLWVAKRAFRYRMVVPGEAAMPMALERFQFQLKDLLIGTTILAIALAPIRLLLPRGSVGSMLLDRELLVLAPMAMAVDLLATLPCLWGGFVAESRVLRLLLIWIVHGLILAGIETGVVRLTLPTDSIAKVYQIFVSLNLSQAAVVFTVMRIYYVLGYRLQRVPREAPREIEAAS
jgi:hypothetical protein